MAKSQGDRCASLVYNIIQVRASDLISIAQGKRLPGQVMNDFSTAKDLLMWLNTAGIPLPVTNDSIRETMAIFKEKAAQITK